MSDVKPLHRKGSMVTLKRALPGAPANTPLMVVKIMRGLKRDMHLIRYECISNQGVHYHVYESDLG
jgi:hypothetical protein